MKGREFGVQIFWLALQGKLAHNQDGKKKAAVGLLDVSIEFSGDATRVERNALGDYVNGQPRLPVWDRFCDGCFICGLCTCLYKTTQLLQCARQSKASRIVTSCRTYKIFQLLLLLHTHPFNGPFSRTTQVGRYQKGKTNLDCTEARDSEWQWHQLGHMQVCTSLQTDNHANTPPLSFLQAGCPSCRPTNSVKALKADYYCYYYKGKG